MAKVVRKEGETIDQLYNRFKRQCSREGILKEYRARTSYTKPGDRRRQKHNDAVIRNKKASRSRRF